MVENTPRAQVAQWVRTEVDGASEIHLPELVANAAEHFSKDRKFILAFLQQQLQPIIYEIARLVMQETRTGNQMIQLGDELVTGDEVRTRANRLVSRWSSWMEHVADRHVRLMDMDADALHIAAAERRKRATTELEIADLWDALAARLEPGETVAMRFTAEEIDQVRRSLASALERKAT